MKNKAVDYYSERRGNCAQSVAWAQNTDSSTEAELLQRFAGCGHGGAPGEYCGALYAACQIAGPEAAELITREFVAKTGGFLRCRDIRKARALPCKDCVGLAASLLEKAVGKGKNSP